MDRKSAPRRRLRRIAGTAGLAALPLAAIATAAPFGKSDDSFSGDGWLALAAGHDHDGRATSVALQGDGKIVSGGVAAVAGHRRFALTRHLPGGGLDAGFGDGGVVV